MPFEMYKGFRISKNVTIDQSLGILRLGASNVRYLDTERVLLFYDREQQIIRIEKSDRANTDAVAMNPQAGVISFKGFMTFFNINADGRYEYEQKDGGVNIYLDRKA
jgi:hypothetical protein